MGNYRKEIGLTMHPRLLEAIRKIVLEEAILLPPENQRIFRLMYGRNKGKRSVEDAECLPLIAVVSEMLPDQLSTGLSQIDATFKKIDRE